MLIAMVAVAVIAAQPASAATVGEVRATIDNAIYSWWVQPVAVNDGAHTWVGSIARLGTVRLAKVDRETGAVQMVEISRTGRADDHNAPAIAFEGGQSNLVVFYTGHNHDNLMRFRTVNRTTLAVGPERQLTFSGNITYAQVLRSGTRLVLFTRVGSSTWQYRVSEDFGATWSQARMFMNAEGLGQIYLVVKPVAGDADDNLLAFYGHPVSSPYRNVEFARLRLNTGAVELADGRVVGNLYTAGGPAFGPGDLDLAITPSSGYKVRLLDIGTVNGRPSIAYAVWQGENGQAQYKVKMHRDGAWSTPPWALASGDPFGYIPAIHYLGGAVIGRDDRLYTARKDNSTGVWYVEQWSWSDSQDVFVFDRELARDNARPLVRPYVPARQGRTEVIVQRLITYDGFTAYDADILVL
ncbi:MAG TPA: BNR-4 repeat-containing protein [Candidatus Limnocylindrales bacterium]